MTSTETGFGIEAKSEAIYELVEDGAQVERLATGFTFTEGPIWHPKEGRARSSPRSSRRGAE